MELFQFKVYGFSAYALTQLFPELTLAEQLHEGTGSPVPYLVVASEFVMGKLSDYIKLVDNEYLKANLSELDQFLVQQWRKFSRFELKVKKARKTTHPKTKESSHIPEKACVAFTISKKFKADDGALKRIRK